MSANQNENNENLTHPKLYRDSVNHPQSSQHVHQHSTGSIKNQVGTSLNSGKTKENGQQEDQWDLYPQLIREIENTGTPEQVEHLHDLERSPSTQ
ncbi:hypothetical protein BC941DRAFT_419423 [Chlamydoabsidia padenii]|nr:hypothetical protein BC941DRAFT_419423 [Chlamydoabsidia padenii]